MERDVFLRFARYMSFQLYTQYKHMEREEEILMLILDKIFYLCSVLYTVGFASIACSHTLTKLFPKNLVLVYEV